MKTIFNNTLFISFIITFLSLSAQAQETNALKQNLEEVYQQYKKAIITKDHKLFKEVSASSHYFKIRNALVCTKKPFPEYLFEKSKPQDISNNMKFLFLKTNGPTANLIYYGGINFSDPSKPPIQNTFVALKFVKENNLWKYYQTEYKSGSLINENEVDSLSKDLSLYDENDFIPSGIIPPTPTSPCQKIPDYAGSVRIISQGYRVVVNMNGKNYEPKNLENKKWPNTFQSFAGLKRGVNTVNITTSPIENATDQILIIEIYATSETGKEVEVFKYEPTHTTSEYSYKFNLEENIFNK